MSFKGRPLWYFSAYKHEFIFNNKKSEIIIQEKWRPKVPLKDDKNIRNSWWFKKGIKN